MIYKNQLDQREVTIPYGQMNLVNNFRTLWLNLSMWTREYLLSIASGLPNTNAVHGRLYQVPIQLGSLLQLIFGQQSAERFIQLLNPFWFQAQWQNLLYTYISMTFDESTAMFSGDYGKDIQIYDRIQFQTWLIGNYMADGILQYLAIRGPQV